MVAGLAVLLISTARAAEPETMDRLFAEDVIFYAEMPDMTTFGETMKTTPWYALYQDEAIQAFLKKPLAKLKEAMEEVKAESTEKLGMEFDPAELLEMLPLRFACAIEKPIRGSFQDEGDVSFQLVAELGDKKDRLVTLLQAIVQSEEAEVTERSMDYKGTTIHGLFEPADEEGEKPENVINYAVSGNYLLVGNKLGGLKRLVDALAAPPAKSIADSANYQAASKRMVANPMMVYYLDVEALKAAFPQLNAPAPMPMPGMPPAGAGGGMTGQKIMEALGVAQVKSVSASVTINESGGYDQAMFIHNPAQPTGILKLVTSGATEMQLPAFVPENATYYGFRVGPNGIYQTVLEVMEGLQPGMSMTAQMAMESAKQETGIDIPQQLFGALGDQMGLTLVTEGEFEVDVETLSPMMMPMVMSMQMSGMLLFSAEVKDEGQLNQTIDTLVAKAAEKGAGFAVERQDIEGVSVRVFRQQGGMQMPGMPVPCLAVTADQSLFALNLETMTKAIQGMQSGEGGLASHPLTQQGMEAIGAEKRSLLLAMNEAAYFRWYASFMKFTMQMQERQMAQQKKMMEEMAAEAEEAGEEAEGMVEEFEANAPETPGDMIDFALWPQGDVFAKYLGVTVGEMKPVEGGILFRGVSIPPAQE